MRLSLHIVCLVAPLLVFDFACSSQRFTTCRVGGEHCACYGNGTCDPGLECRNRICLASQASTDEGGASAGGFTGTGGAASTGISDVGGSPSSGGYSNSVGGTNAGGATGAGGTRATGGSRTTGGVSAGGSTPASTGIVATHFGVKDGEATITSGLPPQSAGTTIFEWVKFPTNLSTSTSITFGTSTLFYQDWGIYADQTTIRFWDEDFGPSTVASNDGGWIFIIARYTSATHIDVGYTRTAGAAITWSVSNTIASHPLQGLAVAFFMESEPFGGDIEYAGVLPRAVDNTEASALSNNRSVPSNAWAFWKFENGVTIDASGNGHNWSTTGSITSATTGAPLP
jgi:hypothetical protein